MDVFKISVPNGIEVGTFDNTNVNSTFAHLPVTHAVCSAALPNHDRHLLLPLANESLDGSFGLWDWELEIHFSQKQVEMWTRLTTAHISTAFLTIWDELWPREPGGITANSWCIDSPRVTETQVAFLDAAADCGKWQWFSEVLLSPCGYI